VLFWILVILGHRIEKIWIKKQPDDELPTLEKALKKFRKNGAEEKKSVLGTGLPC